MLGKRRNRRSRKKPNPHQCQQVGLVHLIEKMHRVLAVPGPVDDDVSNLSEYDFDNEDELEDEEMEDEE